ncbi:ComF family protein [Brevibacillus sp. GCM10020057]|uniref:ComF family protein n=1 Tax=Brevibacillus sp. GCM10020057 TaxID=3317327 RepID=UPI003645E55E
MNVKNAECAGCGRRIVPQAREPVVRTLTRLLSSRTRYPVMYRLVSDLALCSGCLERLPVIGEAICEQCGRELDKASPAEAVCRDCRKITAEPLHSNRSLLRYNAWGKDLLSLYKYRGEERLSALFARLLLIALYRYHGQTSFDCITTVPLHTQRLEERGFNQVDLLALHLSCALQIPVRPLLARTRNTAKLSRQSGRASREESMEGAFSWSGERMGTSMAGARILLIDDIYTTGSTLRSCARTIAAHAGQDCSIYSLTIYR